MGDKNNGRPIDAEKGRRPRTTEGKEEKEEDEET